MRKCLQRVVMINGTIVRTQTRSPKTGRSTNCGKLRFVEAQTQGFVRSFGNYYINAGRMGKVGVFFSGQACGVLKVFRVLYANTCTHAY